VSTTPSLSDRRTFVNFYSHKTLKACE
jgi:hypothetical protein